MHTLTKCTYTSDKWNLPALKIPHVSTQECTGTARLMIYILTIRASNWEKNHC